MSQGDLTVGPVVDKRLTPVVKQTPQRTVEEYKGEPPQHEGKTMMRFTITEKCGLKEDGKPKCEQKIIVQSQKNVVYLKDESGYGGQLEYDEKDKKLFKQCPKHGPWPAGPESW